MSSFDPTQVIRIPALVVGTDIRSLPIGPEEAFVLSRVDGSTRESELCAATGLAEERIDEILVRLKKLGAIQFLNEPPHEPVQPRPHASPSGQQRPNRTIIETVKTAAPSAQPPSALYDPAELDEPVDLVVERRRKILDVFYKLDTLTHYQLFELPHEADRKAIKAAYFDAVNVFHPDRYFGKSLGSFKSKLERVFARITEAHDVLTRAASRVEYDAYLAAQELTREMEHAIEESQRGEPLAATLRELQVRALRDDQSALAPDAALAQHATPEYDMTPDPEARRRAISRKLRAVSRAPVTPPAEPLSADEQKRQALLGLRARHDGRVNQARQQQIEQYLKMADEALAAKKTVSATTTLRLALQLAGDDPALRARLEQVEQQAHAELSETYLAQGAYEERTGRFLEATRSYEKAARGKPEAKVFDKVAHCAIRAGSELHTAVEFGRKAVRTEPGSVRYRQTLIQAYLGAGLKSSALAEIERLEAMNPEGPEIKDWLKRAKHGEL